jgi:hypothetical protein
VADSPYCSPWDWPHCEPEDSDQETVKLLAVAAVRETPSETTVQWLAWSGVWCVWAEVSMGLALVGGTEQGSGRQPRRGLLLLLSLAAERPAWRIDSDRTAMRCADFPLRRMRRNVVGASRRLLRGGGRACRPLRWAAGVASV